MIPYVLHVTVITTICFLFYKLLLQKETFYQLNRWTLMACLAVAFALPLLPVPRTWSWRSTWVSSVPVAPAQAPAVAVGRPALVSPVVTTEPVSMKKEKKLSVKNKPTHRPVEATVTASLVTVGDIGSHNTIGTPVEKKEVGTPAPFFSDAMLLFALQWLFYLYLFGVVIFGGNFLFQLVVLLYQSYSRPVIKDGSFRIVEVSGNRAPCSFGNTIFINPEKYDWETYNQILIHEKIHVSGRHTLDIVLAEIALVIQWFNPFAWWYRREVENNLEFLTDANVLLDRSIERSAYQLSLLRVSAPHLPFSITNNYNQSLLKRRIVMMNSQRSSLHTVWKYFFLLPLLIGLMCALNKPSMALGAATKKLSLAHAPLFNLISPDTTKKPAKASGNTPAAKAVVRDDTGDDDGFGVAHTYSIDVAPAVAPVEAHAYTIAPIPPVGVVTINRAYTAEPLIVQPEVNVMDNAMTLAQTNVRIDLSHGVFSMDTALTDGSWYLTSYGDKFSFELKAGDEDHFWENTLHVDKSELNPFPGQGTVEFKLVRDAGTIVFKGQFDGAEGFGHFHYTPDATYLPALEKMGVEDMEERRQFGFFSLNIKKDYVNMIVHNGYPHISQRDLMSFAAMKIDEAYIQYWHGATIGDADPTEPRNLIRLKAMKIDRAYIDDLKAAGYDHLNLREIESMKSQKIDKDYIHSLGRNKDDQPIPVRELVSYKAMHVDSGYLQALRKVGYDNLTMHDITSLYSMKVSPEFIQELQGVGYKELSVHDLVSLKSMKITPDYIKSFQDAGYNQLSVRELTSLKSQDISPEYIKGFKGIGDKELSVRALMSLRSQNITPEFIKGFTDLGYTDLSVNQLCSLKAMNITPDFVAAFNKLGFDHIPVNQLTSLKATGVNADYITKMRSQGFESKDLNKYIRLKADFN